jgi:5-methylcytosine-specific restriction endonuclease McrA
MTESSSLKAEVAQRAKDCCEYCRSQAKFSPDPFSIEHIVPRSQGGETNSTNLALSCQGCNNR